MLLVFSDLRLSVDVWVSAEEPRSQSNIYTRLKDPSRVPGPTAGRWVTAWWLFSFFLSLQSTAEPPRGDDTKIKVVTEMREGRERGDEGYGGGEVGEWMEKSKPNLERTQHVIKPAKHGESWIQLRNIPRWKKVIFNRFNSSRKIWKQEFTDVIQVHRGCRINTGSSGFCRCAETFFRFRCQFCVVATRCSRSG